MRRNQRSILRIALLVELDAEKTKSVADPRPDERRVFANASGEGERIESIERSSRPEAVFRSVCFCEDGSRDSEEPMSKSRFTDERILAILLEVNTRTHPKCVGFTPPLVPAAPSVPARGLAVVGAHSVVLRQARESASCPQAGFPGAWGT